MYSAGGEAETGRHNTTLHTGKILYIILPYHRDNCRVGVLVDFHWTPIQAQGPLFSVATQSEQLSSYCIYREEELENGSQQTRGRDFQIHSWHFSCWTMATIYIPGSIRLLTCAWHQNTLIVQGKGYIHFQWHCSLSWSVRQRKNTVLFHKIHVVISLMKLCVPFTYRIDWSCIASNFAIAYICTGAKWSCEKWACVWWIHPPNGSNLIPAVPYFNPLTTHLRTLSNWCIIMTLVLFRYWPNGFHSMPSEAKVQR